MSRFRSLLLAPFFLLLVLVPICQATDYHVGPYQTYTSIGAVPWETLNPGDHVFIHWKDDSYNEKWVIGRSGTSTAPITVSGVPGPDGQLPVIDGRNATTRQALNYWNEARGLLKIGGSNTPNTPIPSYIVIEGLELRSARYPYQFTNDSGAVETYTTNAASFYIEIGQHITLKNCILHDSANGIFIGANEGQTQSILIQGNYIYDNGMEGSYYQHNTYTAAQGITYQYNYMGSLRSGAEGNNLKDRSAGLVVRYNWIENGNRQLDLVDAEDTNVLVQSPAYSTTYVYGNILKEGDNEGNSQIIHYGGDSDNEADYRKGTLYLYNNTVISTRSGNTTLLRLSTNDETADIQNNIFYPTAAGAYFALAADSGLIRLRNNWLKLGWQISHSSFTGSLLEEQANIQGTTPGFIDFSQHDYHLSAASPAKNKGLFLSPTLLASHPLTYQYVYHRKAIKRPVDSLLDMGAFEYPTSVGVSSGLPSAAIDLLLLLKDTEK